ncbi:MULTISPECIES: SpoIIE family protein phosphatase [unclassified Streptomyces]|uniref:PP2C family protein-serine/threonine phosphatase n=1 Tax=unclassified Streptomyces TaxID=2593676 RepID=UPI000DBA01E1|nr:MULTISPECIES: SpoIIE family protein phosphatase [unclassified Streptomyces]MYT74891.1 SpoIIE family protein phosphatase [Streptomyces sp. SID8367]RAJ91878.1 serine phosphatase RsbU (regulator of sigma subunit) [Streptomyces sp. PsTaAH-137]
MTALDGTSTAPCRILLVEDDAGDALLVEELLLDTDLDHVLVHCRTLGEARETLTARRSDCILLDLHLPDASGVGAVAELLDAAGDAAVIVLTGLAESQAGVEALAAGAQDYLVKGKVEPDLLQRAVRYAVHRKQAERANANLQAGKLRAEENARLERGLLPAPMLSSGDVVATSRYFPGRQQALLGGDFLDVVETPDGQVHAVIGDVSGHGPDAAALGVCLRIAWRSLTLGGHRGGALLELLEQMHIAERSTTDLFTTCTLVTVDRNTGTASLHLAGHHAPLLTSHGRSRELGIQHGVALGIAPGLHKWPVTTVRLPPSGSLLLYTDGLVEGHVDESAERLGVDRLLAIMDGCANADAGTHLDRILDEVRVRNAGRHTDDLAVLRLDWSGLPAVPSQRTRAGVR